MSSTRLETVKVQDGKGGFKIINKSQMTSEDREYKEKDAGARSGSREQENFDSLTKTELQAKLDKAGIAYKPDALKEDLVKLAESNRDKLK